MSGVTAIHWLATAETDSLKLCITVALYKRYVRSGRIVFCYNTIAEKMIVVQLYFIFFVKTV
jgi:hypothetical protein